MSVDQAAPAGRIYVYSAPGYDTTWERTTGTQTIAGRGKFKVGWTGRPDASVRIREQTGTCYPDGTDITLHLDEPAVRADGTPFTDHDVHHILDNAGIHRTSEVIEATLPEIQAAIVAARTRRPYDPGRTASFPPRPEQQQAVDVTAAYLRAHADDPHPPRFLWNAKMRFGKTFTTYQLATAMGWTRVLVLTYKPAARDAWRDDLNTHTDFTGWRFIDRDHPGDSTDPAPLVWFASFQDLLGTTADGTIKDRNQDVHTIDWDAVVIDEYHFGAWQGAAREVCAPAAVGNLTEERAAEVAAEVVDLADAGTPRLVAADPDSGAIRDYSSADLHLSAGAYLYLSGTPFRALTDGEFNEDAIFNWTYPDEQTAKQRWDTAEGPNPYSDLPAMHMYTYSLTGMAAHSADADPQSTFDLSGYFHAEKHTDGTYRFEDPDRVRGFLNMLVGNLSQTAAEKLLNPTRRPPFPYSDARFTTAVQHAVWFLPSVASAHAMKEALASHPHFADVLVHVAAGTGVGSGADAKPPVTAMIDQATAAGRRTITLSVGKLMTGVTISQWGAILILRSLKSPEAYFQAAFRVQSPWSTRRPDGTRQVVKDTCFVFDFDPNRALSLVYSYGTRLAGAATSKSPADEITALLSFLPIFAFDGGRMDPVDTDAVMTWATVGTGAAMLAKRWGSARLIDLSDAVLTRLLTSAGLVDRLEQMEDFRQIRAQAAKILASSNRVRTARAANPDRRDDPETAQARHDKAKQMDTLRKKLLKLVQRIPVFMYLTDFREESLVHVIESLDSGLFERVTGLTIADFHTLADLGVFASAHMNEAIWQFRLFERASLHYLDPLAAVADTAGRVGLWDTTISTQQLIEGPPLVAGLVDLLAAGWLGAGDHLAGGPDGVVAVVREDGTLSVAGVDYPTLHEAAAAAGSDPDTDPARFWQLPGYGSLHELMLAT